MPKCSQGARDPRLSKDILPCVRCFRMKKKGKKRKKEERKKKFVDINKDFAIIFQRLIGQAFSCGVERVMDVTVDMFCCLACGLNGHSPPTLLLLYFCKKMCLQYLACWEGKSHDHLALPSWIASALIRDINTWRINKVKKFWSCQHEYHRGNGKSSASTWIF